MTGSAGFIGSRLADLAATTATTSPGSTRSPPYYDVRGQRRSNALRLHDHHEITVERRDLSTSDLSDLVAEVDAVFHLAAQPGVRASWDDFATYVRDNLLVTQRLLEAARAAHTPRFVFASSSSVYGQVTGTVDQGAATPPVQPLRRHQARCGSHARRVRRELRPADRVVAALHRLRPGPTSGHGLPPPDRAALTGTEFPVYGDGRQLRAFTFVDDVVDALIRAATAELSPGTVANISGGTVATLMEAIRAVERAAGQPVHLERRESQAGDVRRTDGDITRARELLGWSPPPPWTWGLATRSRRPDDQFTRHRWRALSRRSDASPQQPPRE